MFFDKFVAIFGKKMALLVQIFCREFFFWPEFVSGYSTNKKNNFIVLSSAFFSLLNFSGRKVLFFDLEAGEWTSMPDLVYRTGEPIDNAAQ